MMPRLVELAWLIALREGGGARRTATPAGCTQTIGGMLYFGIRPATHRAA
jgi:hypothetical protein